jgi:hypothetical protein
MLKKITLTIGLFFLCITYVMAQNTSEKLKIAEDDLMSKVSESDKANSKKLLSTIYCVQPVLIKSYD